MKVCRISGCKNLRFKDSTKCLFHVIEGSRQIELARAGGFCTNLPCKRKAAPGKASCYECLAHSRRYGLKRAQNGICRYCPNPIASGRCCEYHKILDRLRKSLYRRMLELKGRGYNVNGNTLKDLGCSLDEYKRYLESKFLPGMTWANRGFGPGKWQTDHIIPVMSGDVSSREHCLKVFHYTNHQPIWHEDHIKKTSEEQRYEDCGVRA